MYNGPCKFSNLFIWIGRKLNITHYRGGVKLNLIPTRKAQCKAIDSDLAQLVTLIVLWHFLPGVDKLYGCSILKDQQNEKENMGQKRTNVE